MNRKSLEYFMTVAKTLNFTEAARIQFVAQTTISRQIGLLEEEIGFSLFERDTTKVKLTLAGETFLNDVKLLLEMYDNAVLRARSIEQKKISILKVGHSTDLGQKYLMEALQLFLQKNENIEIVLCQNTPSRLVKKVLDGSLDIIAIFREELAGVQKISSLPVCECNVVVGVGRNHPLADRKRINARELAGEKIILPRRDLVYKHYDYIINCFHSDGYEPDILEVDSYDSQNLMTQLGKGVAFYPESLLDNPNNEIVYIKIEDSLHRYNIDFAWRDGNKSQILKNFLSLVAEKFTIK